MGYPTVLDSFTTKVDGQDDILAAHMNAVQTAIAAIEAELGLLPKGSAADLVTRLAVAHNADGTLKTAAIVPGAASITLAMLAANAVDSSKIVDASITGVDIAAATITGSNIAVGTIAGSNLQAATVTSAQLATNNKVFRANSFLGTIPTTGAVECTIMCPAGGTFSGLKLISKDALLGSDTNYLTVDAMDMGSNGLGNTVLTAADALDTTKVTGGSNGIVAYASSGWSINALTVAANDVMRVRFTVTGTLPNTLTNCVVSITILLN